MKYVLYYSFTGLTFIFYILKHISYLLWNFKIYKKSFTEYKEIVGKFSDYSNDNGIYY